MQERVRAIEVVRTPEGEEAAFETMRRNNTEAIRRKFSLLNNKDREI